MTPAMSDTARSSGPTSLFYQIKKCANVSAASGFTHSKYYRHMIKFTFLLLNIQL